MMILGCAGDTIFVRTLNISATYSRHRREQHNIVRIPSILALRAHRHEMRRCQPAWACLIAWTSRVVGDADLAG
jgi:hypothetical protein